MIFVGRGALVRRAVEYAIQQGGRVDAVFTDTDALLPWSRRTNVRMHRTSAINHERSRFLAESSDGLVFSIDNRMIFRAPLLELAGFRFYNIHGGLLPRYRGLGEVCIVFALLEGEKEYGVTLHQVDAGIDTGACIDQLRFDVSPVDTFATVMTRMIAYCQKIFEKNYASIVEGTCSPCRAPSGSSRLFTYENLGELAKRRGEPAFRRITELGIYAKLLPRLAKQLEGLRGEGA